MIRGGTSTSSTSRPPRDASGKAVRSTSARCASESPRSMCRKVPSRPSTTARIRHEPRADGEREASCPSTGPRSSVGPSGSIARTSASPARRPSRSAKEASRRAQSGGTPSTVTPETDADGPALAVSRTHGTDGLDAGNRLEPGERRGLEDGDERAEVLPHDDVGRHRERRLVPLARGRASSGTPRRGTRARVRAPGRRPRSRRRLATGASETPARRAPRAPPPRASVRPTAGRSRAAATAAANATRPGQDEEHDRRGAARGELVRLHRAAREDAERRQRGSDRGDVDRGDPPAASAVDRDGHRDHAGSDDRRPEAEQEARRGEQALREHVPDRRSRGGRDDRAGHDADHPADDRAAEADGGALGPGQERPLPRLRAVPREPPPRGREIAPHGARREDGEGDEQRGRLAADEQQPPAGDGRGALRFAQLLRRQRDATRRTSRPAASRAPDRRPERRPSTCQSLGVPAGKRLHPGVAPIRPREDGRRDEARDALGHDERRGGRAVVRRGAPQSAERPRHPRARCRSAARKSPKSCRERRAAVPTCTIRRPGTSGSLPVPRRRSTSQRSGRQVRGSRPLRSRTYGAEPVDGREPDEGPADRALADERDRRRVGPPAGARARCARHGRDRASRRPAPRERRTTPHGPPASPPGAGRRPARRARSFATVVPARISASTAAAAVIPSAATSAPPSRRRRRLPASARTYPAPFTGRSPAAWRRR